MRARSGALLALVALLSPARGDDSAFDELQALIAPGDDELAWSRLGWLTDPWAARARAAAEGRPLFLWEMDGHPLGCT